MNIVRGHMRIPGAVPDLFTKVNQLFGLRPDSDQRLLDYCHCLSRGGPESTNYRRYYG